VPSSSHRAPLANAAALGAASGLRTFGGLGGLALRGTWGRRGRTVALAAAAGEIGFDKLPMVPPRSDVPGLAGRAVTGALAGRAIAGSRGAGAGAACALATAYGSERLRAMIGQRTGVPDVLLGAIEDALAIGAAAAVVPSRDADVEQQVVSAPDSAHSNGANPHAADDPDGPPEVSPVKAAIRGLVAAAVGTAAMTSVQMAYIKVSGGSSSSAPAEVGQRIVKAVSGREVPREHHDTLNQSMHMLYGTAWGLPFGLTLGSLRRRPSATASGLVLGLSAWGASLAQLPALDLAPPPWEQAPAALAGDLAFHLVYGTATAAVYQALSS
jgi:uncharacterized membrane protein